jgi:hypothetical protein
MESISLYETGGIIYITLSDFCAITARFPMQVHAVARNLDGSSLVQDKDSITRPGVKWSAHRLKWVIRVDALPTLLRRMIPTWSEEKIAGALAQLDGDVPVARGTFGGIPIAYETPVVEDYSNAPIRKRKFAFDEDVSRQIERKIDEIVEIARTAIQGEVVSQIKFMFEQRFH